MNAKAGEQDMAASLRVMVLALQATVEAATAMIERLESVGQAASEKPLEAAPAPEPKGLEPFKAFALKNAAAGQYPESYAKVMHLCVSRDRYGLSDAFVRIGYRWMVDRPKFYAALSQSRERSGLCALPKRQG